MTAKKSTWETLTTDEMKLEVDSHRQKKGNLDYISWAWAWGKLKDKFPNATFEKHWFDDVPYTMDAKGYAYVQVTVTVEGSSLTEILPVLDHKNKPVTNPDSFQVNTTLQRCLCKAIAYHGLGFHIYAGEDLEDYTPEKNSKQKETKPSPPSKQKEEIQKVLDDPLLKKITQTFDIDSIRGADGMWGSICDEQGNIISGYDEAESTIILDPKDSPDQRLKYINDYWPAILSTINNIDDLLRLYTRSFKQDPKVYEKEKRKCCPTGLRHLAFELNINTKEELGKWEPMKLLSHKKANILESSLTKEKK